MTLGMNLVAIRRPLLLAAALSLIFSAALPVPSADAYHTWSDHRLVGGIHNRTYFLDSTVTGLDAAAMTRARDVWNPTATNFWFYQSSTTTGAAVQMHHLAGTSGVGAGGFCARTVLYYGGAGHTTTPTADWGSARIDVDPANFTNAAACGAQTDQHRGAIVAHEWGHAIGLAHDDFNAAVLMYTQIASTSVSAPTGDDINGANHLY